MQIFNGEKVPILFWGSCLENEALAQGRNLANHPYIYHHVALMPDVHVGYGMPIGGVGALREGISPHMVGVDIGCGMLAVQTSWKKIDKDDLKRIVAFIQKHIPMGFKHHTKKECPGKSLLPALLGRLPTVEEEWHRLPEQLGTLGGGNHFIEIQRAEDEHLWFMIHSGSRNLGLKIATHHNRLAIKINEKMHLRLPSAWQLAFFPLDSEEGISYLQEMNYALSFARANRRYMGEKIKEGLSEICAGITFTKEIDVHHNYATIEEHFGQRVVVHRKGAISAKKGESGIIPGAQGTASYLVKGLGNDDSFQSSSHGAGRRLGRKEAIRSLSFEREKKWLDERGIMHSLYHRNDLEEAASAYKDIEEVMNEQKELTQIERKLLPLAVVKG